MPKEARSWEEDEEMGYEASELGAAWPELATADRSHLNLATNQ